MIYVIVEHKKILVIAQYYTYINVKYNTIKIQIKQTQIFYGA